MWLQPQETEVPIVTSIIDEEGERSLLPMLPSENYLVFELPTERDAKNLKALNRGIYDNPVLGRRFLELVVAAKDNQIKIKLPQHETFVMGSGINEPALPAEATKWVQRPQQARLISINDLDVWRELKGIASHCGYTWDLADRILKKQSRARMVNEALKPLQRLWECENKERLKAGQEALKPLPKIDVVLYLSMHYGGTVAMLGFRGAPNSQAYNDMISWGVL
ncbi:hypothetical protein QBC44DRAFT_336790 [Cladorrhinum sp. PSN332]|nr:hypothetical protein QBC44DRAFT_336790 [Cladorrhinum sp. PSN332]